MLIKCNKHGRRSRFVADNGEDMCYACYIEKKDKLDMEKLVKELTITAIVLLIFIIISYFLATQDQNYGTSISPNNDTYNHIDDKI